MSVRVAIDAATDRLSLAADRDGGNAVTRELQGARRHAGALLPLVAELLTSLRARPRDISLVAVADGPGSFTGLRVSFAAAKALAAEGAGLVTAPSLLVRAAGGLLEPSSRRADGDPGAPRVLAVSSALRGELYAGLWRVEPGRGIEELLAPRTLTRADVASLPAYDRAIGDGPEDLLALLHAERVWPEAATLLRLAGVPGGARVVSAPAEFEPRYGRPAEAAARWEHDHGRPLPDSPGHAG